MEKENDLASYEGHGRTGTAERQTQMRTGTRPCQAEPAAAGRELQCSPAPSPEIPLAPQGPRLAAGVGPPSQLCGVGATPPHPPALPSTVSLYPRLLPAGNDAESPGTALLVATRWSSPRLPAPTHENRCSVQRPGPLAQLWGAAARGPEPPATGRHTSGAGRLLTQARKPLAASPPAVKRGLAPGSGRTWQRASGSRESRSRCRNSAGVRAAGTLDDGMNKHTCEPVRWKRGGWRGSGRTRGGEDSRPSTFGRPGRLCRAVTSE